MMQNPKSGILPCDSTWSSAPSALTLGSNQVDIWRVPLTLSRESLTALEKNLAPEDSQRATRFHFQKHRDCFIAAHGCLRDVLSRYLHLESGQITFSSSAHGKPHLSGVLAEQQLEFNLSHSHEIALIAVTHNRRVGIDIECIREDTSTLQIAERFFSANEIADLLALPREQRVAAFFNCWTRKEAYIKAHGLGLSLPLDSFDVSLSPGEPALLRATRPDSQEALHWTLRHLEVSPGYAAAVAVEGMDMEFRLWDFAIENMIIDR